VITVPVISRQVPLIGNAVEVESVVAAPAAGEDVEEVWQDNTSRQTGMSRVYFIRA
jgi:hypothetical protein